MAFLMGGTGHAEVVKVSQSSSASIDQQMSEKARKPPRGSSFYYQLTRGIIPYWETTVDAAGLHTLLNQNPKAYTLFKPNFSGLNQSCAPRRSSKPFTNEELDSLRQCISAPKRDVVSELFDVKNQSDLQRVLKCHVVPKKILLKDLPNDKDITFQTMEPGCTVTVRAKHLQVPEQKAVTQQNPRDCGLAGIGRVVCTGTGETTRYVPTGKILNLTDLFINKIRVARSLPTDGINKGNGNYIEYDVIDGVTLPPDLQIKYAKPPAGGRPLTD